MKYSLAIFDLDGTVLDTLDDLAAALNHALEASGFPGRTRDETREFVGNGIEKLLRRAAPENIGQAGFDALHSEFSQYYEAHCEDLTKPYDGIFELLSDLKKSGCALAVVSNKPDSAVKKLCARFFPDMLVTAIGARNGISKKPAPDSVNEVLAMLSVPREKALYIGDSDVDIETARAAKIDCVSVTWGFRDIEFLRKSGAVTIVSRPREIYEIITDTKGSRDMVLSIGRPSDGSDRLAKENRCYDLLDSLCISYMRVDHAPAMTMEACEAVDAALGTVMCKNLFLCNRQQTDFYLLLMPGNKKFLTKELSAQIGTARLSFGSGEQMEEYLGLTPGSATVMGLMNDPEKRVSLLIDEDVLKEENIGFHPCINTSSVRISITDFKEKLLPALGHEYRIVKL